MAYVALLTSTDCAFWPVPFRNYDLMPPKVGRRFGSFWVARAGLGPAISVLFGRILDHADIAMTSVSVIDYLSSHTLLWDKFGQRAPSEHYDVTV
jgi:hypothetical protein